MDISNKKILILGGAAQHCKVVEAAHEMGLYVYVTDYLPIEDAPAKQIADVACFMNFCEVDEIVDFCKKENIDGVLNVNFEAPQHFYYEICKKLDLPCFGTKEQYKIFTDKVTFKKCCEQYGIDTIIEYSEADIIESFSDYPILIKPSMSHGSRGISICNNYSESISAIEKAKEVSESGEIIIEKYMGNCDDFTMTYLVIDSEPVLMRTADRYLGSKANKMNRSCLLSVCPSYFLDRYCEKVHPKMVSMIKSLGIKNAPLFVQGFIDGDTVRFYDPGLRYSGSDYERLYEKAYDKNMVKPLIHFAITGSMGVSADWFASIPDYNGKKLAQLILMVAPGKIAQLSDISSVLEIDGVVNAHFFYKKGDTVGAFYNAKQKLGEVDFISDSLENLLETIEKIYKTVIVRDENDNDLLYAKVSTDAIIYRFDKTK